MRLIGQPPFKFLARHLVADEDFVKDARRILALSTSDYSQIATRLREVEGFLNRADIVDIAKEVISDASEASDIAGIIHRISSILHDNEIPASKAMDELAEVIQSADTDIARLDRERFVERVRGLALEPSALARQFKARRLVEATTGELEKLQVICDIRPIFDQERQQIDGAIPLSTVRIDYVTADGEDSVTEFRITESQLQELAEVVTMALRKLGLIKNLLAGYKLTVPTTKATATSEEA